MVDGTIAAGASGIGTAGIACVVATLASIGVVVVSWTADAEVSSSLYVHWSLTSLTVGIGTALNTSNRTFSGHSNIRFIVPRKRSTPQALNLSVVN